MTNVTHHTSNRDAESLTLPGRSAERIAGHRYTLWERLQLRMTDSYSKPTGLENCSMRELLALCQNRGAFRFATESNLSFGYWSAMVSPKFLRSQDSGDFKSYLRSALTRGTLLEIGVRDRAREHAKIFRSLGAQEYVGIDRQQLTEAHGGIRADALEYLVQLKDNSLAAIAAFGVFNHPMQLDGYFVPSAQRGDASMQKVRPGFMLPARFPEEATTGHTEHEYARRVARELERVLQPEGLFFGDGIFWREAGRYLEKAGLTVDTEGEVSLPLGYTQFGIKDPFFLRKLQFEEHKIC